MTNEQLIAKFNPANAVNLTADDLELMRSLTDDQIDVLADAFPNTPSRRAYLLLYDNAVAPERQLYQMSTWQNLRNVRKYANKKNLVPYTYKSLQQPTRQQQTTKAVNRQTAPPKVVVDMSAKDAAAELKASLGTGQTAATTETKSTTKTKTSDKSKTKTKESAKTTAETGQTVIPPDQDFTNGESES